MGIVYGAMLANLVPALLDWWQRPTGFFFDPPAAQLALRVGLTAMAAGILMPGLRDVYAILGFPTPRASWPWRSRAGTPATPRG
jgi:hypothetical protein